MAGKRHSPTNKPANHTSIITMVILMLVGILCLIFNPLFPAWLVVLSLTSGGASQKVVYDFDVSPKGDKVIFNCSAGELCVYDEATGRISLRTPIKGQVIEVKLLDSQRGIVAIQQDARRPESDILLYRYALDTKKLERLTSSSGVWEQGLIKISQDKCIFDLGEVKKRLQPPWGWDIYALLRGSYIVDLEKGSVAPLQLDTGSAYYNLEQVLPDRKTVVLSFRRDKGSKWYIASLDKAIDEPNPKVVRREPLPMVADQLIASDDGKHVYYTVWDASTGSTEIYRYEVAARKPFRVGVFRERIARLRMSEKSLWVLTDSAHPAIWQFAEREGAWRKVVQI